MLNHTKQPADYHSAVRRAASAPVLTLRAILICGHSQHREQRPLESRTRDAPSPRKKPKGPKSGV